ncbi:MAG: hypothetical protein HUK13_09040 [Muribaculaceae bacterium]|nr:hypothetical protein [Muribaculaceae bacterium]
MKKYTLMLATAFTALAMTAAPGQTVNKTEAPEKAIFKAPVNVMKVAEENTDQLIIDRPDGKLVYYDEIGDGFQLFWDQWFMPMETNEAGQIVWAEDNVVYLKNAVSSYIETGWVKGTLSEDGKKITVKYPQRIREYVDQGVILPMYASVMQLDETTQRYFAVPDDENFVTYTVGEDGVVVMDGSKPMEYETNPETGEVTPIYPEKMVSMYYVRPGKPDKGEPETVNEWFYYGDTSQKFQPIDMSELIVNDIPEGLVYEEWAMVYGTDGSRAMFVNVAIDGNNVYLTNIDKYYATDCVVKGTIDGNTVTFPSKQFYGVNDEAGYFLLFFGTEYGEFWDEEMGEMVEGDHLADNFVMTYDAEGKKLSPAKKDTGFCFNTRIHKYGPYSAYSMPTIFYQSPEVVNAAPRNPEVMMADYNDPSGQYITQWNFPNFSVNGAILKTDVMYYEAYVNGELYTFSPEIYTIPEEMTMVPYDFSDEGWNNIVADGAIHFFIIRGRNIKSYGIKMYYDAPDGNTYTSDLVTYIFKEDGIDDISADAEVSAVELYNLQGMKVATTAPGNIYLRATRYTDGTKKVTKFIAE